VAMIKERINCDPTPWIHTGIELTHAISRQCSTVITAMSVSYVWLFSEACAEIKPFDQFWCIMVQNARNHARMCLLGLEYLILFTP